MRSPHLLVVAVTALALPAFANDKADRVFLDGRVFTGNPEKPRAEALAVRGPRILAVGETKQVRKRAEKHTDVVDLGGAFVVPGFIDSSQSLLSGSLPKELSSEERFDALRKGLAVAASLGLTGIHDATASEEDLAMLDRLERDGALTVRVHAALEMLKTPTPDQLATQAAVRAAHQSNRLRVAAVRCVLDGRIESGAAWLLEPYASGGNGRPAWTPLELEQTVAAYHSEGWQVQIQASGDRAVAAALDAVEKAVRLFGRRPVRHRIELAELVSPADLIRMKALDIVASTQPLAALNRAVPTPVPLDSGRDQRVNAFRLFDDAGVVQAFGTGWPVFRNDILLAISVAASQPRPGGTLAMGAEAALRHFTRGGAYASGEERSKGVLEVGSFGDFTVLSEDILSIPPSEIPKARVLRTVVAGNDVFVAR